MFRELRPYSQYRSPDLGWASQIPTSWGSTKLKRLVSVHSGATPSRGRIEYWDGNVPWVTPKVMKSSEIVDSAQRVSPMAIAESNLTLIQPPAVLLVVRGMILARRVPVAISRVPLTINQDMKALVPNRGVDAEYLSQMLSAAEPTLLALVSEAGHGTRKLDSEAWMDLRIPVAGAEEQAAIVKYLAHAHHRVDRAIAAKRRLIALLEEQKWVVAKELLTDGDRGESVAVESSRLWPIGRLARVGNGSTPSRGNSDYWGSGGDFPWLNSSHANRDRITDSQQFVTKKALAECHLPIVPPGSILVAITGQGKTRGKAALLEIESTINQHLAYISPNPTVVRSRYLLLSIRAAYHELRRISDASGSTKGALTCQDLKAFRVMVPPLRGQDAVAARIDAASFAAESAIERTQREIELLREYRTRLTSDVVTGQLDVRHIAADLPNLDPVSAPLDVDADPEELADEAEELLETADA